MWNGNAREKQREKERERDGEESETQSSFSLRLSLARSLPPLLSSAAQPLPREKHCADAPGGASKFPIGGGNKEGEEAVAKAAVCEPPPPQHL